LKGKQMSLDTLNSVVTNNHQRAVGTFPNHSAAENALQALKDSGFSMDRVSVVAQNSEKIDAGKDAEVSEHLDNRSNDGAMVGAMSGGTVGSLTGLLVGIGVLAIPGIGPIMLAGAAATALATTAVGGVIGASTGSLLGGLIGLGIPEERAKIYHDRVTAGQYLVMVDGTDSEISRAKAILQNLGIEEWEMYDLPPVERHSTIHTGPVAPGVDSFVSANRR
jgi:hypothetical protein